MPIYVDQLIDYGSTKDWKHGASCHLFADDENGLHEFAKRLQLLRKWFQPNKYLPHYDLTENKRKRAVAMGAIEVDFRFVADRIEKARAK